MAGNISVSKVFRQLIDTKIVRHFKIISRGGGEGLIFDFNRTGEILQFWRDMTDERPARVSFYFQSKLFL